MARVASKGASINIRDKPDLPEFDDRRCQNLYSESELMRNICDYVTECMCSMGYQEEHMLTNCRIALSGLASAVAVYAISAINFPEHSRELKLCVGTFFFLLFLLFALEACVVKTAFIAVLDKYGKRLLVGGRFVTSNGQVVLGLRQSGNELTHTTSVGRYFDSEGYFVTDNIFKDLQSLLIDFECGLTNENKAILQKKKT